MQGHGVGAPTNMSGNHRHRAELAHGAGVAKNHAIQQAPLDGQATRKKVCHPLAPSAVPAFLFLALGLDQRDQLSRNKGKRNEDGGQHDSRHCEDNLQIVPDKPWPEQPLQSEEQNIDQS